MSVVLGLFLIVGDLIVSDLGIVAFSLWERRYSRRKYEVFVHHLHDSAFNELLVTLA